jgi:altronate dehydratase
LQLGANKTRYSIILHKKDNVATILDSEEENKALEDGTLIEEIIPIGHKAAIRDIMKGQPVIKYGVKIGVALTDIPRGKHVHIHNCT